MLIAIVYAGMQAGKRKLAGGNCRAVRVRQPAYFLPELAHVVAAADERVPFVNLAQEVCFTLYYRYELSPVNYVSAEFFLQVIYHISAYTYLLPAQSKFHQIRTTPYAIFTAPNKKSSR